jgi:hypothetical protein
METNPKFSLDAQIDQWRDRLTATAPLRPEDAAELENHLREAVGDLRKRGLSPEESFLIGTRRLGHWDQLAEEYAKVSAGSVWPGRVLWMLAGVLLFLAASSLSSIASSLVLIASSPLPVSGFAAGWFGLAVSWSVLLGVLLSAWGIARWGKRRAADWVSRRLMHPVIAGIGLAVLMTSLQTGAVVLGAVATRTLDPRMVGAYFVVHSWGSAALAFLIPLALAFAVVKLAAARESAFPRFSSIALLLTSLLAGFATGCGQKPGEPVAKPTTPAPGSQTPLEQAITLTSAGQMDQAVATFLKLDWAQRPFSPGSILNYSEVEFAKLPRAAMEQASKPMMADLDLLKKLVRQVRESGQKAQASGDSAKAKQCFQQIQHCGESLDRPDSLKIVQLVGQAFKRTASADLTSIPGVH